MDRERLKGLAQDKKYISGIYNYCDRWCERCPYTSRCLNFEIGEEEFSDPETRDIHNEAFWEKISEIMQTTLEMLHEMAVSKGIDLEDMDIDENAEEILKETSENHVVCRMAREYIDIVEEWINGTKEMLAGSEYELSTDNGDVSGIESLKEAIDVIKWYQPQIYVKLMRAVSGLMEEANSSDEDAYYAKDSDGSAKVALIGIDRSIAAWGIIGRWVPNFRSHDVPAILTHLERLRRSVEKVFPDARGFLRPGFDQIDLNS